MDEMKFNVDGSTMITYGTIGNWRVRFAGGAHDEAVGPYFAAVLDRVRELEAEIALLRKERAQWTK